MNILEIFYNEIVPEAALGKIDCYFTYNIVFNTIIEGKEVSKISVNNNDNLLVPSLIISQKNEFDKLLTEYVTLALTYYDGNFFGESYKDMPKEYIKSIEALLWSDATSMDFSNPETYLRRKINFLKDENLKEGMSNEDTIRTSIGLLEYKIKKDQIFNETPRYIEFSIDGNILPVVRFGISDNKAYIYAIQNITKITRDKKFNRALYKVNEGVQCDEEKDNINNPENIVGITPSTLISATLAISLFKKNGINEIVLPCVLPMRWNAKELAFERKLYYMEEIGRSENEINEYLNQSATTHEEIQRNLTDKFIRTFRRLEHHFDNIEVTAFPFEEDEFMHIEVGSEIICNNKLLEEVFMAINNNVKKK